MALRENPSAPPTSGGYGAWCLLRQESDLTHDMDAVEQNMRAQQDINFTTVI